MAIEKPTARGGTAMVQKLTFVSVEDPEGKVKQSDRQKVRSQCMRGINKRADSQRSLRAARQAARATKLQDNAAHLRRYVAARDAAASETPQSERLLRYHREGSEVDYDESWEDTMKGVCGPKRDLEVLQLIHRDSAVYPREVVHNCEWNSKLSSELFALLRGHNY